uniref:Reverse transcriptase domain-containing protein n=1 Tax=Podarcis muralis TaxID=64176 RepID=A0A670J8Y1_PODMU
MNQTPAAAVLLAGDLNARIGQSDEALYAHFHDVPPISEEAHSIPPRLSKDKGCNYAGLCLLRFSNNLDLTVLNGRVDREPSGEFTFISNMGASTIDYVLVSSNLLSRARECKVVERVDSDHLPLCLILDVRKDLFCSDKLVAPCFENMELRYSRIKWSSKLSDEILERLHSDTFLARKENLVNSPTPEARLDMFRELISSLQPYLTNKKTPRQSLHSNKSKPWFDQECTAMKRLLLDKYRNYRSANLPSLPLDWFELKRSYKALINKKKLQAQREEWQCLVEPSQRKDSAMFWKIIAKSWRDPPIEIEYSIPAGAWEAYFLSLYSSNQLVPALLPASSEFGKEWPPVTTEEIIGLIQSLKSGKAPGADNIPPEILKANVEWWAPVLAALFTSINQAAIIPEDWGLAIIIPIFKKGNRTEPANYRPISLLSIISKLYAAHLCDKLVEWMEREHILSEAQAGFRAKRSTIDQALILQHLADKYSRKGGSLYAAFVDFKSAFDLIPRDRLWEKLGATNIDKRLLRLIRGLYENTRVRVRCDRSGHLTKEIQTHYGVKQGCVLAPMLFNFYINSLAVNMAKENAHPPKLAGMPLPVLLYADDAVLLSFSCVGLRKLLRSLADYCQAEQLSINYSKSKIMVFSKKRRKHKWRINGQLIDQVATFKYLGITFQERVSWHQQMKNAIANAGRANKALTRFFHGKGGKYVPAASQVFAAKILPQLTYGSQVCSFKNFAPMEAFQTKFYRCLLGIPPCVSNIAVRLEVGQPPVNARLWILKIHYWLKLIFSPAGLAPLTLLDTFHSTWKASLFEKIRSLGFSPQILIAAGYERARSQVLQRIRDIELQCHMGKMDKHATIRDFGRGFSPANYLADLQIPKYRHSFTLARFYVCPLLCC